MDIMGPLPESDAGILYIMVASDYFTKWVEVYAIPNQEAITVARKLTDEMFCRFSPPEQLHSDQGSQFEAQIMQEICKLLHIKKTRTSPYHPQCDGLVERFNRTLLDMLATTTRNHPFDWEDQIRKVCMAYNTSVHSSTGYTPFYLMFGRQAKLPIDLMYATGHHVELPTSEYATQLKKGLEEAYARVREKLTRSHERRKENYDRKVHGDPYNQGDLVWMHTKVIAWGESRKLHHPWIGPFKILERLGDSDYRIKGLRGKKQVHVVHFDRLKRCTPGTRFTGEDEEFVDQDETPSPVDITPACFGQYMELLDHHIGQHQMENEPRYPQRMRHAPDRYETVIAH